MKNLCRISSVILITLFAIVAWTGCKKEKGPDIRDSFVATYNVVETWTENSKPLTKPAFTMSVELATQHDDMLLFNNFGNYGAGITVEATVKDTAITIAKQTLPNSKEISGSVSFTGTTLTITYTEVLGSTSIAVTATANKL